MLGEGDDRMGDGADKSTVHQAIDFIGMRAQATAAGLVQLSIELRRSGVIDERALDRVKDAIAEEITHNRPRSAIKKVYQADIRGRLDRIFTGAEPLSKMPVPSDNPEV